MKANVYSVEGKSIREIELPEAFGYPARKDLIKRAVLSEESREYQPKGSYKYAGLETSARYIGRKDIYMTVKNRGIPHLPHEIGNGGNFGKVKRIPGSVKGRRAHPPKPWKKIVEKINKKEYRLALISAISATAQKETVSKRMNIDVPFGAPIIMDNSFEALKKTKDVLMVLKALKLEEIIEKSKKTGKKTPLIVVSGGEVIKAASNIAGVDAVSVDSLKVKNLAPGTHPGRLTIYSEKALEKIAEKFGGAKK